MLLTMLKVLLEIFSIFLQFLKFPLIILFTIVAIFCFCCSAWFVFYTFKGKRLKRGQHKILKRDGFFKNIFYKLPKRIVLDNFERDPDFFRYQGCVIFEGRQGAGKTIGMIEFASRMLKEYPLAKCTSNLGFTQEDTSLEDWKMLLDYKNDIYGVIVILDELQNWFSSKDSKDFPPEMLEIITQNRKNRRIILRYFSKFLLAC